MKYFILIVLVLTILPYNHYTSTQHEINYSDYNIQQIKEEQIIYNKITSLEYANFKQQTDVNKLSKAILKYSKQYNISSDILISIAYIESKVNKYARNKNCIGIFQLNSGVHKLDPNLKYDEDYQTMKACEILSWFINRYKNITLALNGYNGQVNYKNGYANKVSNIINLLQ